jgi:uncharacterized membrane protein YphA (DoxX/SURF4 family)
MATNPPLRNALAWLGRFLLGGTFVVAAGFKILDPTSFVADIGHYRLLPYPLAVALGVYLPWLELLCGTAVLIGRLEQGALLILAGLCGLFTIALASAWARDLDITCGCFGHATTTSLPLALARSLTLGLIAVLLLRRGKENYDESRLP